jgi:tRNA dimethylallyltransferase
MKQEKLVVILGPTATGKSRTGILLAQKIGRRDYLRGQHAGLPGDEYRYGQTHGRRNWLLVPHHLVNILPPAAAFSVVNFKERAQQLITEINGRGSLPILVGGTGLYIKALLENYTFSGWEKIRTCAGNWNSWQTGKAKRPWCKNWRRLDPEEAAQVDPRTTGGG